LNKNFNSFKEEKLKTIHNSVDINSGRSKLFDENNLSTLEINKNDELYLLFLPDFIMDTPFHFLLTNKLFTNYFMKFQKKYLKYQNTLMRT
jgi:hypothetical protein